MRKLAVILVMFIAPVVGAQENSLANEKKVSPSEAAIAFDANGAAVLEGKLLTTSINGAADTPVTNARLVVRNTSSSSFAFVSGILTFYDAAGVRCGEGVFKADVLAANESFETDTPGLRISCPVVSWRMVATSLIPRVVPSATPVTPRLIISIDGDQHPLQLDKPLTLSISDKTRTIVVRQVP
jgi:hypothetical protein